MSETVGGRWEQRRGVARSIRISAFLLPVVGSIVTGSVLTAMLPQPTSTLWGGARWIVVAVVASAVLFAVERVARRLIPLSVLFRLSLAFPDSVPSRLGLALRIGTTMQLKRRIEATSTAAPDETPGEAARRLLELVGLLSRHDRMTRGHSERVRAYAHVVGVEMGITGQELEQLRWSALLHDVGKIRVPSEILNKPGRLTDEEFAIIKTHPMAGKECVEPLADWLGESVRAVWEHHERFDGGGYPQGLSGTDISRAARIVCAVDAYDVMTSVRSYKRPMSGVDARAELSKHAGTQFDPSVVRAFLSASIGATSSHSRRTSWLSQVALIPRAVVRQLGPSFGSALAVGTAAAVGAVGGTVGIAMAERPPPVPAESSSSSSTIADGEPEGPVSVSARTFARPTETLPQSSGGEVDTGAPELDPIDPATSPVAPTTTGAPTDTTTPDPPAGANQPDPTTTPSSVTTTTTGATPPTTGPVSTVPNSTLPDVTVPTTTLPGSTIPNVTIPNVTIPNVTIPNVTLPQVTLPQVTIPDVTLPTGSVPQVTIPDVTLPQVTTPDVTVPQVTVPQVTVPTVTVPVVTLPDLGL